MKVFPHICSLNNFPTGENQYGCGGPRPNGPRVPEPLGFRGSRGYADRAPQHVPHRLPRELSCRPKNCYLGGPSVSKPCQIFLCIHFLLLVCMYCFIAWQQNISVLKIPSFVIIQSYSLCSKQINNITNGTVQMLWSAAEHKHRPRYASFDIEEQRYVWGWM